MNIEKDSKGIKYKILAYFEDIHLLYSRILP
jgi:hypothetical protein